MDLIGLVKDSFEAVAQEVGAACQRTSCTAVSDDDARQRDNARTPGRAELQMPEGSTASTNATALANSAAPAHEDTSHDNGGVENRTTKNESVHAEVDSQSGTNVSDDDSNDESSELSVQPSEFPNQLRLLVEVMQTASQQLSAVATDESGEPDEDPQTIATAELQAEQVELRKLFESRIHSDEVQARALERLHSELQTSRKHLQRAEMAPLFKDIIFCHDFVTRELVRDDEDAASSDWRKSFEVLGQMLVDVLFKYDVEPFRSESDEFDRSMQQCVRSESTTDAQQDKQIATSGLIGFRTEERILRREQVTVFRYRPSG
jgi:molecular chaperone GrpE (heat shock protein)